MSLERLSARLLWNGVPPSLLIDLHDPDGMARALAGELVEVQTGRALQENGTPQRRAETA